MKLIHKLLKLIEKGDLNMMLNEFICSRIGATFEDLYNSLAIKEILNNKEKYKDVKKLIRLKDSNVGSYDNIDTFPTYMSFLIP